MTVRFDGPLPQKVPTQLGNVLSYRRSIICVNPKVPGSYNMYIMCLIHPHSSKLGVDEVSANKT